MQKTHYFHGYNVQADETGHLTITSYGSWAQRCNPEFQSVAKAERGQFSAMGVASRYYDHNGLPSQSSRMELTLLRDGVTKIATPWLPEPPSYLKAQWDTEDQTTGIVVEPFQHGPTWVGIDV